MQPCSSPLSAQIAALRSPTPSGVVEGHWLHRSVIEIICACLTRLFTRLDQMLQLWQAGTLPILIPRTPASRTPAIPVPPRPRVYPLRRLRLRHPAAPLAPAANGASQTPISQYPCALPASPGARARIPGPRPRIRAAHGPPPPRSLKNANSRRRSSAALLLRYQNKQLIAATAQPRPPPNAAAPPRPRACPQS